MCTTECVSDTRPLVINTHIKREARAVGRGRGKQQALHSGPLISPHPKLSPALDRTKDLPQRKAVAHSEEPTGEKWIFRAKTEMMPETDKLGQK